MNDQHSIDTNEVIEEFRRAYWIVRVTSEPNTGKLRPIRLLAISALLPLATVAVSSHESTLYLFRTGGRGLMEHLGWWAQYLMCPLLILLFLRVIRSFASVLTDPRFTRLPDESAAEHVLIQRMLLKRCCAQTRHRKRLLGQMFTLGALCVIVNFQNTRMAELVYGEDVWDSSHHLGGYLIGKLFLTFEWGYLFPLLAFVAYMIGLAIHYLVKRAAAPDSQQLLVFAHDGCGGYRPLGAVMIDIVYMDVPIAVIIACLHLTHANEFYPTIILATLLFVVVVIVQLFLPFVPLHERLHQLKEQRLRQLEDFLARFDRHFSNHRTSPDGIDMTSLMAAECVYRQTIKLNTWPYGTRDVLKAVTPFIPSLASLLLRLIG